MANRRRNQKEQRLARELARREGIPYTAALAQLRREDPTMTGTRILEHETVSAWSMADPLARRAALEAVADEIFVERGRELSGRALLLFQQAFAYVGLTWSTDPTVAPAGYAAEIVDTVEAARHDPEFDARAVYRTLVREPMYRIGAALHEELVAGDGQALDELMRDDIDCDVPPVALRWRGTGGGLGRQLLRGAAARATGRMSNRDALGAVRILLARTYPDVSPEANRRSALSLPGSKAPSSADLRHAYHRTLERADLVREPVDTHQAWIRVIPLRNVVVDQAATVGDVERLEIAVAEMGGSALVDIRRLHTEHPNSVIDDPSLENWPQALLERAQSVVGLDAWRQDGATVAEVVSSWTPIAHEQIEAATRGGSSPAARARALYGVARLCAELHAVLRAGGVEAI
jgi:hypothetical protein